MSKAEANKTIDQYMNLLENARMEAGKQIDKLEVTLKKAAQEWKEIKHEHSWLPIRQRMPQRGPH